MTYLKLLFVSAFLLFIFFITYLLQPELVKMGDKHNVQLESIIPDEFNGWKAREGVNIINPVVEGGIQEKIYSQTLAKSYVNRSGEMVILSIAYGKEQKDDLAVHFPEACYPAQGFNILSENQNTIRLFNQDIPVKQLVTKNRNRNELVTYWARAGNDIVISKLDQKMTVLKYALTGTLPDGLIFRTSTINTENGFDIQEKFIKDLFSSISNNDACSLIGHSAGRNCVK